MEAARLRRYHLPVATRKFPESFLQEVARSLTGVEGPFGLRVQSLRGGLVADEICHVRADYGAERRRTVSFVAKRLCGTDRREAEIYDSVVPHAGRAVAPHLYAVGRDRRDLLLALEWVRPFVRWPWPDLRIALRVTRWIAALHDRLAGTDVDLPAWDYEAELEASAAQTLALLERLPAGRDLRRIRRTTAAGRRVARALPEVRRALREASPPLQWSVIHGDLHPGNLVLRRRESAPHPVLLDWSRLRMGSPLEDVSSWLLSLGHWERVARRRHDTLLRAYLDARGGGGLTRTLRDHYWLAAASNALSGALRFQLVVALERPPGRARREALVAAAGWARTLERAAEAL